VVVNLRWSRWVPDIEVGGCRMAGGSVGVGGEAAMGRGKEPARRERSFGVRAACCRFPSRKLACGKSSVGGTRRRWHDFRDGATPSQQAGWGKSGSKLHALQSFAARTQLLAPLLWLVQGTAPHTQGKVRETEQNPDPNLYVAHPLWSTINAAGSQNSFRTGTIWGIIFLERISR
jgi:hypothetical protein